MDGKTARVAETEARGQRESKSRRVRSCTPLIRAIPKIACNHCLRVSPGRVVAAVSAAKLWWQAYRLLSHVATAEPARRGEHEPTLDNQLSTMPGLPLPLEQLAQTLSRHRAVEFVRGHIEHQFFPLTAIG